MHTSCKGCKGKMSNVQAAHGLQDRPLMSAPSSFSPDDHNTGTRRREALFQANYQPKKLKISMNMVFGNQVNKLWLLENTCCHCDQGMEQNYNYSISFHFQNTNESGNWHLELHLNFFWEIKKTNGIPNLTFFQVTGVSLISRVPLEKNGLIWIYYKEKN